MIIVTLKDGSLWYPDLEPDRFRTAGGPGSGNFGHAGRPGEVGGSGDVGSLSNAVKDFAKHDLLVYHGTSSTAAEHIRKEGIKPSGGKGADAWAFQRGMDINEIQGFTNAEIADRKASVFLTSKAEIAKNFAEFAAQVNPGSQPMLIVADVPASHLEQDVATSSERAFTFKGTIRPEWIQDIRPVDVNRPHKGRIRVRAGDLVLNAEGDRRIYVVLMVDDEPTALGGPGSGNFGHAGRPGEVGGSSSAGGHTEWKSEGGWEHSGITWKQPTDPKTGRPVPIKVKDVETAAALVLQGKVVEVPDPRSAYTLVDKLAAIAADAKAKGDKAPEYDLCQVSVAGSNMFCAESLRTEEYPQGVPRLEMPQLGGVPVPGSEADKLPRNPWDPSEVDGSAQFVTYLQGVGIKTTKEVLPAAKLKASQRELIGQKVAKMVVDKTFDPAKNPIFISSDNYVVDGHHRWAAIVLRDAENNVLGDAMMNAVRVNAPISEVLHLANAWADKFGIQQAAGVKAQAKKTGLRK